MQVLPALEVKNRFGKVSTLVDRGEIVTVTKHGEPTMVFLPVRFAQEIKKALRIYYHQKQGVVSAGILEWLEELAPIAPPAFDEQAEKQKIREMIAKEFGIPTPKPTTKAEALAFFDRYDEEAKNLPVNPEFANMTEDEFMEMVDKERESVWQEKQAKEKAKQETPALVASH